MHHRQMSPSPPAIRYITALGPEERRTRVELTAGLTPQPIRLHLQALPGVSPRPVSWGLRPLAELAALRLPVLEPLPRAVEAGGTPRLGLAVEAEEALVALQGLARTADHLPEGLRLEALEEADPTEEHRQRGQTIPGRRSALEETEPEEPEAERLAGRAGHLEVAEQEETDPAGFQPLEEQEGWTPP